MDKPELHFIYVSLFIFILFFLLLLMALFLQFNGYSNFGLSKNSPLFVRITHIIRTAKHTVTILWIKLSSFIFNFTARYVYNWTPQIFIYDPVISYNGLSLGGQSPPLYFFQ